MSKLCLLIAHPYLLNYTGPNEKNLWKTTHELPSPQKLSIYSNSWILNYYLSFQNLSLSHHGNPLSLVGHFIKCLLGIQTGSIGQALIHVLTDPLQRTPVGLWGTTSLCTWNVRNQILYPSIQVFVLEERVQLFTQEIENYLAFSWYPIKLLLKGL